MLCTNINYHARRPHSTIFQCLVEGTVNVTRRDPGSVGRRYRHASTLTMSSLLPVLNYVRSIAGQYSRSEDDLGTWLMQELLTVM